jgi:MerR family transcriptional regulator/heat shock protein HspR
MCHETMVGWVHIRTLGHHPQLLERLAELGVIDLCGEYVREEEAARVEKILRLRRALGVNTAGAAVILDLLERIEELQDIIRSLKRL